MNNENIIRVEEDDYSINSDQDADFQISHLKNQLQYYKNKNSKYNDTLTKLKITPDNLSFASKEILEKLTKLQEASGVNKLEVTDIGMSYLEFASARIYYKDKSNKLKLYYENLYEMTENILQEIEIVDREIKSANSKLDSITLISGSELQKLKMQIKSYEEKLLQYINKYPWINEPEYNLLSIQDEIKKVYKLQEEVEKLRKEVEVFCGLKPDIIEAKNQLIQIKSEYNNISKTVSELM